MSKKSKQEQEQFPVLVSLCLVQVSGGWSVLTIHSQGDKVLNVESTEPDVKAVAMELYRIKSANLFMS